MENRLEQLRFVQRLEQNMLKIVVEICEKENLSYYISGGTYLGAVRHRGFIPWDDDIDIALPRNDYARLLSLLPEGLPPYLELVTFETRTDYNYLRAQIWDHRIELELVDYSPSIRQPVWIDLFPLDGVPDPGLARSLWKVKLDFFEAMWGLARISESSERHQGRSKIKQLVINIGHALHTDRFLDSKKWCRRREHALSSINVNDADYVFNGVGAYKYKSIFPKSVYGGGANYDFGGMALNGPANYDAYLSQIYGDYMSLPSEDKRNWHGTELVKRKKYSIGYTQGTFDMFHGGHLNLLEHAKELCDYLIVGVNSDELVWEYKHKHPVICEAERRRIVAALNIVDEVVISSTLDKEEVLKSIPFEAIFIGDDWRGNARWSDTKERLAVRGIDTVYLPHTEGVSSTMLRPQVTDRIKD